MLCEHKVKVFRQEDGCFPKDCSCSVTYRRGYADGRRGHPPAECTVDYLHGYKAGQDE